MMISIRLFVACWLCITTLGFTTGGATVGVNKIDPDEASAGFGATNAPAPVRGDLGERAVISVMGDVDPNSGGTRVLNDGQLPTRADQPRANFFFRAGSQGGRIQFDLGAAKAIREIRTFSWHPGERAPQVYAVYGARESKRLSELGADPVANGFTMIAKVDTREQHKLEGGQYAVTIGAAPAVIGEYQYLLFAVERTDSGSPFGQTFFSEIDILDDSSVEPITTSIRNPLAQVFEAGEGRFRIRLENTEAPDLTDWVRGTVNPMVREWYPRIASLLSSEGYEVPRQVTIVFSDPMQGVAGTVGSRIECAAPWFRKNLEGEALGAVFHELVHVVQQYKNVRAPGWLVEGIADYVRWYRFEPKSGGAEIRNVARARYDGSYRVTANFLNFVSEKYGKDFVPRLNAIIRERKYSEGFWKESTGKTLPELNEAWIEELKKAQAPVSTAPAE